MLATVARPSATSCIERPISGRAAPVNKYRSLGEVQLLAGAFGLLMSLIPDRVAFESPQGRVVSGPVVDSEVRASTESTMTLLTVDVDGTRLRVPERETTTA